MMFFSTKIKIGIIVTLLVLLGVMGWRLRAEIREAASLAQQIVTITEALHTTKEALENEREEKARAERLLRDREAERNRLRAESERLRRDMEELRRTDVEVSDWAAVPVPNAIRMRKNSDGDAD